MKHVSLLFVVLIVFVSSSLCSAMENEDFQASSVEEEANKSLAADVLRGDYGKNLESPQTSSQEEGNKEAILERKEVALEAHRRNYGKNLNALLEEYQKNLEACFQTYEKTIEKFVKEYERNLAAHQGDRQKDLDATIALKNRITKEDARVLTIIKALQGGLMEKIKKLQEKARSN